MPVEGAQTPKLQSPHPPRPPQVAKRWTHLLARAWWCLVLCTTIFEQRSRLLPKDGHERRHANQHPYVTHKYKYLMMSCTFFEQIPTFQFAGISYHWMKDDVSFIYTSAAWTLGCLSDPCCRYDDESSHSSNRAKVAEVHNLNFL